MNTPPEALACRQFLVPGTAFSVRPYGNGLINDTFLVEAEAPPQRFILQRINAAVFPQPEQVLHNHLALQRHISSKPASAVALHLPALLNTMDGQAFYRDGQGGIWRALQFIDGTSLHGIGDTEQARQIGVTLGHFHRLLSDLPATELYDTLPSFHDAPAYARQYRQALLNPGRPPACAVSEYCAEAIAAHEPLLDALESAKRQGILAQRIIHGDPKLDNFLFADDRRTVVGLLDLDTVKPGLVHYDLGDCLRSCCREGEPAHFNVDICTAILRGYLQEACHFMGAADHDYLYTAIQLLPFELGLRFFTDYLNGNRYFKAADPQHNLRRALDQLELLQSIEAQQGQILAALHALRTDGTNPA